MERFLKELAFINLKADYQKMQALLLALKDGSVKLENINLTPDGWTIASLIPTQQTVVPNVPAEPAEPATVPADQAEPGNTI